VVALLRVAVERDDQMLASMMRWSVNGHIQSKRSHVRQGAVASSAGLRVTAHYRVCILCARFATACTRARVSIGLAKCN
jgi:hypothetical protein